ncbi:hypothetical protein sr11104 [Sporisorium reilianum SRZ2]|uniref:Uncharacterized protein n=1 Tax=Sporisorium reilianum (strain SRZ2) TaxID=999809 RepID=E7A292_SPORE|nr:hypothetical protein sr11104 [Sporisorium reilianum SRZ2]
MSSAPSTPHRAVVGLLNRASTTHRLRILDQLVSDTASPLALVAERTLRLSLPEDDELLRSLLAREIETHGEAETLVRWALKFTATTNFFVVLQLKADAGDKGIIELLMANYAPGLWETYGEDEIYISPDAATAEMQIELLFPASIHAAHAPSMAHTVSSSSESGTAGGSAFSQASAQSSASSTSRASLAPNATFKARAIPTSVKSRPSIEPRLSRAAALRMGVQLPASPARTPSRTAASSSAAKDGISGVTKRAVAPPASLKAPSIAPRLNKAALARSGQAEPVRRPASAASGDADAARQRKQVDFSNTPGHKRLSLAGQSSIASIAPPAIAPRQNRASMGRIQHQPAGSSSTITAPPSALKAHARAASVASARTVPTSTDERDRRPVNFAHTPGHKRASLSLCIPALAAPSVAPRQNRASLARTRPVASDAQPPRSATRPAPSTATATASSAKTADFTSVPGHKRTSLSFSLASLGAPAIAPRLNRAAGVRIGAGAGASVAGSGTR